jgi:cytochrome P450
VSVTVPLHTALNTPPGPPPRRGVVDSLGYYYQFYRDSIGVVRERFERYGDIYYAPSDGVGLFVLKHPEHIWQVLVRDGAKYGKTHTAFKMLERVLGHGLLTTDGEVWRRQRRMIQPAFSSKRLAGYADAMVDEAQRCAEGWYPGQIRDLSREMMELTLRVVCRTLFSHDVRGQADTVAGAMGALRTVGTTPDFLPSWMPSPIRSRSEKAVAELDRLIYGMIAERRGTENAPQVPDLLHMLLTAVDQEGDGGVLDDKEIRDQLVTLFLAGHETTSHALTWTWYLLSQNPEVEAKLHAELDEVLGGRAPRFEDLDELPYTGQVFDEAMRIYPPAYTLARRAEQDAEIDDYFVPKGAEIMIWLYMTHHDPRWYPEPDAFVPERFEPARVAQRPKLSYLPFGAGARACIGKNFALIEAKLILAMLAQRFRFELAHDQQIAIEPRITLAPKHGMRMKLLARTSC